MLSGTARKNPYGTTEEKRLLRTCNVSNIIMNIVHGLEEVTIGEALEAASQLLGNKLLDSSDAAAIQSALGAGSHTERGSFAARAQSAAYCNAQTRSSGKGITLRKLLKTARACMAEDRPVTKEDAERVEEAEKRNSAAGRIHPTGVAVCMKAAAMLNGETDAR